MVQNDLDEFTLVEKAESLSLPSSVVEFFQVRERVGCLEGGSTLVWTEGGGTENGAKEN